VDNPDLDFIPLLAVHISVPLGQVLIYSLVSAVSSVYFSSWLKPLSVLLIGFRVSDATLPVREITSYTGGSYSEK